MKAKPINRGRGFLTRGREIPTELLTEKICTVKPDVIWWVVETPLGAKYLIELFAGGTWGLTPYLRAGIWDAIRTFGRLKHGEWFVGNPCPPALRRKFSTTNP